MGVVHRTVAEEVPGRPADVRLFYVDLDRLAEIHPLVVSVRSVARRAVADGYLQTYRVKDIVPLGVLRIPISYTAQLQVPADGPVVTRAKQFPRVRLDSTVSFEESGSGTLVTERIRISAPAPLLGVTARQAVAAHTEMLGALRRRFERG